MVALIELSDYVEDSEKANDYFHIALKIIQELSSERYQSRAQNAAFLLHATGHKPGNSEIDYSIIYADYYYLEALRRLKKKKNRHSFLNAI